MQDLHRKWWKSNISDSSSDRVNQSGFDLISLIFWKDAKSYLIAIYFYIKPQLQEWLLQLQLNRIFPLMQLTQHTYNDASCHMASSSWGYLKFTLFPEGYMSCWWIINHMWDQFVVIGHRKLFSVTAPQSGCQKRATKKNTNWHPTISGMEYIFWSVLHDSIIVNYTCCSIQG